MIKRSMIVFLFGLLFIPSLTLAHPGNTAADGCHYCRTNCDYWGEEYGERHCHGGSSTDYSDDGPLTDEESTDNSGVILVGLGAAGIVGALATAGNKKK